MQDTKVTKSTPIDQSRPTYTGSLKWQKQQTQNTCLLFKSSLITIFIHNSYILCILPHQPMCEGESKS